jgi:antitoxin (DNA-binding transcriptional repressor) of toxin-antitoxin stability system
LIWKKPPALQVVFYLIIIIQINIHQTKTHLSKYITSIIQGEEILLCKHNIPVAKIIPDIDGLEYQKKRDSIGKNNQVKLKTT